MSTTQQCKIIILVLGVCIFLFGCSSTPDGERLPSIGVTATKLPELTEPIEEKPLPTITLTPSREKSECSSIKVETELPTTPEHYIGKIFDTLELPNGLEFVFGSRIGDSNFTLTHVIILENDTHLLWLSEIKCRNVDIQDVLVLPEVRENEELVIRYCRVNGQEDPEILAIGEYTSGVIPLTKLEYVWRANRETTKFETLSFEGIECWRDIGINSP